MLVFKFHDGRVLSSFSLIHIYGSTVHRYRCIIAGPYTTAFGEEKQ